MQDGCIARLRVCHAPRQHLPANLSSGSRLRSVNTPRSTKSSSPTSTAFPTRAPPSPSTTNSPQAPPQRPPSLPSSSSPASTATAPSSPSGRRAGAATALRSFVSRFPARGTLLQMPRTRRARTGCLRACWSGSGFRRGLTGRSSAPGGSRPAAIMPFGWRIPILIGSPVWWRLEVDATTCLIPSGWMRSII